MTTSRGSLKKTIPTLEAVGIISSKCSSNVVGNQNDKFSSKISTLEQERDGGRKISPWKHLEINLSESCPS